MKVFPTLIKEQTFSLSELVTAVELLCDQLTLRLAHTQADPEADIPEQVAEAIAVGYCPACVFHAHTRTCYVCTAQIHPGGISPAHEGTSPAGDKVESDASDWSTLPHAITTPAVTAAPATIKTSAIVSTTGTVTIPAIAATTTSASSRWYVVTVGRETGIFQGWHNVHPYVVGVPGACFGRYSSHASADMAYAQALQDGTVQVVPV
ncbi:hypothetical protein C8R48DRAFT_782484 [Suillus tomentosus]|nr:hypothetical protein C8R48DRAFT_782484 [Suillus tomentosus]